MALRSFLLIFFSLTIHHLTSANPVLTNVLDVETKEDLKCRAEKDLSELLEDEVGDIPVVGKVLGKMLDLFLPNGETCYFENIRRIMESVIEAEVIYEEKEKMKEIVYESMREIKSAQEWFDIDNATYYKKLDEIYEKLDSDMYDIMAYKRGSSLIYFQHFAHAKLLVERVLRDQTSDTDFSKLYKKRLGNDAQLFAEYAKYAVEFVAIRSGDGTPSDVTRIRENILKHFDDVIDKWRKLYNVSSDYIESNILSSGNQIALRQNNNRWLSATTEHGNDLSIMPCPGQDDPFRDDGKTCWGEVMTRIQAEGKANGERINYCDVVSILNKDKRWLSCPQNEHICGVSSCPSDGNNCWGEKYKIYGSGDCGQPIYGRDKVYLKRSNDDKYYMAPQPDGNRVYSSARLQYFVPCPHLARDREVGSVFPIICWPYWSALDHEFLLFIKDNKQMAKPSAAP